MNTTLNKDQQTAVSRIDGPVLIIAGAGSGKTTVLVERIAHILQNTDTRPYNILAITFTNKAARELKERLVRKLGAPGDDIFAATFHSSCVRLLRQFAEHLGYGKNFTIYDSDDQLRAIKEIYKLNNIDEKFLPYKSAINRISRFKDQMLSPSDVSGRGNTMEELVAKIYDAYEKRLKSANAFDFDNLIFCTVKLLETSQEVREYCHRRFRYIMVDEFQDTSVAQFRLVSLLTGAHNNLCVVGDDDQSIYRFRGATIENILSFEKHYPTAEVIKLTRNYRSTQNILDAANSVIENNEGRKGKQLYTEQQGGSLLSFFRAPNEFEEATHMGEQLGKLMSRGGKLSDCAILYRMNAQSGPFEAYCARSGIPYKVVGGLKFFDRKVVKDILAYLCILVNPGDDLRLKRIINVPARGIGQTSVDRLSEIAAGLSVSCLEVAGQAKQYPILSRSAANIQKFYDMMMHIAALTSNMPLPELCTTVIRESGYEDMLLADKVEGETALENLSQLVAMLNEYAGKNGEEATLQGFLEEVALITDLDSYDGEADMLVMMTIHAAKGLEFDNVFIVGMEDGIFPMDASRNSVEDMEEERRLCYVALTRARKKLYISAASQRMLFGQTKYNKYSRFLTEIPETLFDTPPTFEEPKRPQYFESVARGYDTGGAFDRGATTRAGSSPRSFSSAARAKGAAPTRPSALTKKPKQSAETFNVGDKVQHDVFGVGMVKSVTPLSGDTIVEVAFDKVGTKKTMANYAPMKKV